jgi:hypothetical protein
MGGLFDALCMPLVGLYLAVLYYAIAVPDRMCFFSFEVCGGGGGGGVVLLLGLVFGPHVWLRTYILKFTDSVVVFEFRQVQAILGDAFCPEKSFLPHFCFVFVLYLFLFKKK